MAERRRGRLEGYKSGNYLSTSANWLMDGSVSEDPTRNSYEDLELGMLTSYFSFRPPSPRPLGTSPPTQQSSQKKQEGPAGTNKQLSGARISAQRVTEADSTVSDSSCLLSPSIIRALEGVHYIADHLRAEDADFSVSIYEIHVLFFILSQKCTNVDLYNLLTALKMLSWSLKLSPTEKHPLMHQTLFFYAPIFQHLLTTSHVLGIQI